MSWIDRIQNTELVIITGDGKEYRPLWKESKRNINFNVEGFDFVGVEGTFVDRKLKSGTQHPILLYFQGEDCIEQTNAFELSSRDPKKWTLIHPFFDDEIFVQPLSLEIDTSNYNVGIVSGVVWETIDEQYPSSRVSPKKLIESEKEAIDSIAAESFELKVGNPTSALISPSQNAVTSIGSGYQSLVNNSEDATRLTDLIRASEGKALNVVNDVIGYMTQTIALINFPFEVAQTIQSKLNQMFIVANDLFTTIFGVSDSANALYESAVTTILTECSLDAVNATYSNRNQVVDVITAIDANYQLFLTRLDSVNYDIDSELALQLDKIINLSLANLFEVAFNAKQERTIILDSDSNIIVQAHKLFGSGDENLQNFIDINQIGIAEYLIIKKGRKLSYFV